MGASMPSSEAEPREAGARILVADDEESIRNLLSDFLTRRGYQVETAEDGEGCLEKLRQYEPRVLLLDLKLPKLSGLEVLRRIQRDKLDVKVITLSGHGAAARLLGPDSVELGAVEFLQKPLDLKTLEATLSKMLAEG